MAARKLATLYPQVNKAKLFSHDVSALHDVDALVAAGIQHVAIAVPNADLGKVIHACNLLFQSVKTLPPCSLYGKDRDKVLHTCVLVARYSSV